MKSTKEILDSFPSYQGSDLLNTPDDVTLEQIADVLTYGYMCTISDGHIFFTMGSSDNIDLVIERCLQLDSEWYSKVATRLNFLSTDYDFRMSDMVAVAKARNIGKSLKEMRDEISKILGII